MLKKLDSVILEKEFEGFTSLIDFTQIDEPEFTQLANSIPLIVYCNDVDTWRLNFVNSTMQQLLGKSSAEIIEGGLDYIKAISDPAIFDSLFQKVQERSKQLSVGESFIYNQRIRFKENFEWVVTCKKKINNQTYLNLAQATGTLGHIGEMMEKMMQPASIGHNWSNFDKLTESERNILEQLYEGKSSETIAKGLYISVNTVNTHRKNVLKKLEASSSIEAIRIYEAFSFLM